MKNITNFITFTLNIHIKKIAKFLEDLQLQNPYFKRMLHNITKSISQVFNLFLREEENKKTN